VGEELVVQPLIVGDGRGRFIASHTRVAMSAHCPNYAGFAWLCGEIGFAILGKTLTLCPSQLFTACAVTFICTA
ncbi:MAG: hypothetical protein ACREO9_02445, partial [Lysobacterales bacterium]